MSQESYDRVGQCAVGVRKAIEAYLEARYQNYLQRDVTPKYAYGNTLDDLHCLLHGARSDAHTWLGIGRGLKQAGVSEPELGNLATTLSGTDSRWRAWIRTGYERATE